MRIETQIACERLQVLQHFLLAPAIANLIGLCLLERANHADDAQAVCERLDDARIDGVELGAQALKSHVSLGSGLIEHHHRCPGPRRVSVAWPNGRKSAAVRGYCACCCAKTANHWQELTRKLTRKGDSPLFRCNGVLFSLAPSPLFRRRTLDTATARCHRRRHAFHDRIALGSAARVRSRILP